MTAPFVADAEALREALAEPLARALGEFHNNPEWTSPVGSVGLDDEPAFRAAQGRWEEQEEERQAQTEAMRWALEQPAVIDALASVVQPREDAMRSAQAETWHRAASWVRTFDQNQKGWSRLFDRETCRSLATGLDRAGESAAARAALAPTGATTQGGAES